MLIRTFDKCQNDFPAGSYWRIGKYHIKQYISERFKYISKNSFRVFDFIQLDVLLCQLYSSLIYINQVAFPVSCKVGSDNPDSTIAAAQVQYNIGWLDIHLFYKQPRS